VTLLIALVAALLLQIALQASALWWVLASCQPLLVVLVLVTRRYAPVSVAWIGLVVGIVTDLLGHRILGPGAIAGATAGLLVAFVVRRFDLEGPLFWIVGSLLATTASELTWLLVIVSMGATPDHWWLGALATVATTAALGFSVAAGERLLRAWRSPERLRRRVLRQL
jgi:rod shape-determining protein MreD